MKITLFTANQFRHNYLINLLSKFSKELYVVQENDTIFPGEIGGHYPTSDIYKNYFSNVVHAQKKLFGENFIKANNLSLLSIKEGEINKFSTDFLKDFLKSDIYIVTGSSFIKGDLANFLIKKKNFIYSHGISAILQGNRL